MFVSRNSLRKNRLGRSVKKCFLHYFFGQKSVFYACFTLIGSWEGRKNFRVGIFLNKNLLGKGYRKQTTFVLGLNEGSLKNISTISSSKDKWRKCNLQLTAKFLSLL